MFAGSSGPILPVYCGPAFALDHAHKAWDDLLKRHVAYVENGNASRVSYAGFAKDRASLKQVLDAYQAVTRAEFDQWTRPRQQAFLIIADNREMGRRDRLQRRNQPVKSLFPVDASKEQDQYAVL